MNKKELIRRTAAATGKTQKECAALLDAMLTIAANELAGGGDLLLTDFGALHVKDRSTRMGVHPATGEPIEIPAGRTVTFTPGGKLKAKLQAAHEEDGK